MEIINFFLPYFPDLHRNENYMDAQTNHENNLTIKLSQSWTQMLVRVRASILSLLTPTFPSTNRNLTQTHREMKQRKDNSINQMGAAHFLNQ